MSDNNSSPLNSPSSTLTRRRLLTATALGAAGRGRIRDRRGAGPAP